MRRSSIGRMECGLHRDRHCGCRAHGTVGVKHVVGPHGEHDGYREAEDVAEVLVGSCCGTEDNLLLVTGTGIPYLCANVYGVFSKLIDTRCHARAGSYLRVFCF